MFTKKGISRKYLLGFGILTLCWFQPLVADNEHKCLIVASYHDGFAGQKLKVDGALKVLEGNCQIQQFDMDTKRNPEPEFAQRKALEAKGLIEQWQPDVVIAIEDNAAKYLIQPYFKDSATPFVFAGIDWTAEKYGLPYKNATGIIEISPVRQLLKQIQKIKDPKTAMFIRPDRLSAVKNFERYERLFTSKGIALEDTAVRSMDEFKEAFLRGQSKDFIFFTSNAAIHDWDDKEAAEFIANNAKTLIVSQSEFMLDFSMLTYSKVLAEQGEYAASVALEILDGKAPEEFPVVANRKWNIYANVGLLNAAEIKLPAELYRKAKKVNID